MDWPIAFVLIFCTPFGWIGLFFAGLGISMVIESIKH
jgi:hypothetical protein